MKNQNKIIKFEIFSIIFVSILGTLLHFTFQWSNNNNFVAAFSAINESTWEHLKLLFFPMLISSILGYFYLYKTVFNFWCARIFGIIVSTSFVIIFFFTYTGILGNNIALINIASFFISILLGEFVSYTFMISNLSCNNLKSLIIFIILFFLFVFFTYFPPKIGLFKDPITNSYGIINNF